MKSRWLSVAVALTFLVAGLVGAPALAQTTSTVEGTITDSNNAPLPGASVELKGTSLQGVRTVVSNVDGRFRFPAVPPGTYTVTSNLSGFKKVERTNVKVSLDATANVAIKMEISVSQEIVVTGEAPIVDTATTTTGTNYTSQVISKLPVGRNYADIVRSQPGVQTDTGETQGRSLALSIYGSTSAENLYLIDGVNTTNVIKGFQGKAINNEFVEEVEVKTGGYQAEFGRNTGGVVNVITKSGGNEFHGEAFGYYDNTSMKSKPRFDATPDNSQSGDAQNTPTLSTNNRTEGGIGIGGYFMKDRLWFYGAYDHVKNNQEFLQHDEPNAGLAFPLDIKQDLYSAKLTIRAAEGTTIVGSVFADPQTNDGILGGLASGTNPNTYNGHRKLGGADYAGRVTQLFGTVGLGTLQYSRHKEAYLTTPQGIDIPTVINYTPTLLGNSLQILDGFGSVFGPTINNESKRDSFGGSMSLFVGSHEIKLGGDYQKDVTSGATYYTGGQRLRVRPCTQRGTSRCDLSLAPVVPILDDPSGGTTPIFYQHDYYTPSGTDLTPLASAPFNVPSKMYSLFVQDTWKVLPNLSVNAGVRYDDERVIKGNNELAFDLKNQWAPRVGFTWDPLKDGSSKVYGSWGKFYWPTPTDLNARVFTANTQIQSINYSSSSLDQFSGPLCTATVTTACVPRARLIQVGSFEGEPVTPGLKASYQHELTFGVEKAIDPTLSLGMKFTYRKLGPGTIEDRCDLDSTDPRTQFNSCAIANTGGSDPIASGEVPTCSASANPTDPQAGTCFTPGAAMKATKREFKGIEVVAKKQISNRVFAQVSYLYSTLRGNYSGAIREASGQTDPGINADFDYAQFQDRNEGKLELDRPHQLRLDTVYQAPFGLAVGLQAYVRSGRPTNRLGYYNNFYPDLIYLDQRGSGPRLPTDYEANLSLAYNLKVGPITVTPQLFIFNLLNRQTVTNIDERYNPNGTFTDSTFGAGTPATYGVQPGQEGPDGTVCQGTVACSDNVDYRKATGRVGNRALRAAVKITF